MKVPPEQEEGTRASASAGGNSFGPVLRTAQIISGKWNLRIICDLARGVSRFGALQRSLAGINPKTLTHRLRKLEEAGVISRTTYREVPPRVEYALTAKGQDLLPLIEHMRG